MSRGVVILGSLVAALILIGLLVWNPRPATQNHPRQQAILLYCAAGLKPAIEPVIRDYEQKTGRKVQVQYGGSGTLLGNLKVAKVGDLFLAADGFFLDLARSNDLLREVIPLARMTPVIAVPRGNPKRIQGVADLLRPDVRLVLANPEAAAIGRLTRDALESRQGWKLFADRAVALKTTVNDLANDLKLGAADATFLLGCHALAIPRTGRPQGTPLPESLLGSRRRRADLLPATPERAPLRPIPRCPRPGPPTFPSPRLSPGRRQCLVDAPELVFYSGGVNRTAIEETLRRLGT